MSRKLTKVLIVVAVAFLVVGAGCSMTDDTPTSTPTVEPTTEAPTTQEPTTTTEQGDTENETVIQSFYYPDGLGEHDVDNEVFTETIERALTDKKYEYQVYEVENISGYSATTAKHIVSDGETHITETTKFVDRPQNEVITEVALLDNLTQTYTQRTTADGQHYYGTESVREPLSPLTASDLFQTVIYHSNFELDGVTMHTDGTKAATYTFEVRSDRTIETLNSAYGLPENQTDSVTGEITVRESGLVEHFEYTLENDNMETVGKTMELVAAGEDAPTVEKPIWVGDASTESLELSLNETTDNYVAVEVTQGSMNPYYVSFYNGEETNTAVIDTELTSGDVLYVTYQDGEVVASTEPFQTGSPGVSGDRVVFTFSDEEYTQITQAVFTLE